MRLLKKSVEKASLLQAALATVAYAIMNVVINFSAVGVAGLLKITGGASILDFEFGYSAEKAYQMLTALGVEGRAFYLSRIIPLDFPFPAAYMLFFFCWTAFLLKKINSNKLFLNLFLLLPVLAMLFDWAENVCIIVMLKQYPAIHSTVCAIGSCMTILKTVFTYTGAISVSALLLAAIVSCAGRRRA